MTRTNIPIRLRFLKIPTAWELRTVKGQESHQPCQFAFPRYLTEGVPGNIEIDAWQGRKEFLNIRENDNAALIGFLNKVGEVHNPPILRHWSDEVTQHLQEGHPVPVDVQGLWKFRNNLRLALLNRKQFPLEALPDGISFDLHFELDGAAAGIVTLTDAYRMLWATVFVDMAKGLRFKVCQREDCGEPFPLESKHKRKFCSWYCAHITTVRRNRPKRRISRRIRPLSRTSQR